MACAPVPTLHHPPLTDLGDYRPSRLPSPEAVQSLRLGPLAVAACTFPMALLTLGVFRVHRVVTSAHGW